LRRASACLATLAFLCSGCLSTPVASPAATQTATSAAASATPPPTPGASQLPPGTFENRTLGYRITVPVNYRLSRSQIVRGQTELLGQDIYTTTTEAQARAECLQDRGDMPSPSDAGLLIVSAYRNVAGLSAVEWARSRPEATLHTVEPATAGGLEAARLVQQGETQIYVIRASDRMYELSPNIWPSPLPLLTVAATFAAIVPQPFPTPTPAPSQSSREAAAALGRALATAFAARDADGVSRALEGRCWIGVGAVVGGQSTGGALNRSVPLFLSALRDRFAAGDLTVTVDPLIQVRTDLGGDHFFVRSDWRDPDRTTRIDMDLAELDGQWLWIGATHYYASLTGRSCIPYRSPWVSATTPAGQCS
jgi:hypothetical protein